jgi:cytochrome c2
MHRRHQSTSRHFSHDPANLTADSRMSRRQLLLVAVGAGTLSAVIALSIFGGYLAGTYRFPPAGLLQKVEYKLFGDRFAASKPKDESKTVDTIFFPLNRDTASVPVTRGGSGGGLTSFGDAVLVLTLEGTVFAAKSAHDVVKTAIDVPDNGYADLVAASTLERYRGYWFTFHWFRYNAILHYSSGDKHGLAISYTEYRADQECYVTAVAILPIDPSIKSVAQVSARKGDWEVIFRTKPCLPLKPMYRALEGHMAGGRLAFAAPGTIYLASGDYHWDGMNAPKALAQDDTNDYGKVIAIDLASRQSRIVSRGNRNMQGIALDGKGQLWALEHGMRGGDELNRIVEGANYGWPEESLGTLYSRLPIPNTRSYGRHDTFTPPTYAWLPSVGMSNLSSIDHFHPAWDGDLLAASLIDRSLYRIRVVDNRVLFAERIPVGHRIRYAHVHTDGRLVLWTDENTLIFLTVAQQTYTNEFLDKYLAKRKYDDNQRAQVELAVETCMSCHSFTSGVHTTAPSLATVFEAKIASTAFDHYSDALRAQPGHWSRENLAKFLDDPQGFASGTSMPDPGIDDPFLIGELIDLMQATSVTEPETLDRMRAQGPPGK